MPLTVSLKTRQLVAISRTEFKGHFACKMPRSKQREMRTLLSQHSECGGRSVTGVVAGEVGKLGPIDLKRKQSQF